jgi:hypothetical protein
MESPDVRFMLCNNLSTFMLNLYHIMMGHYNLIFLEI